MLFPAKKAAPPSENWMYAGMPSFAAASRTEFTLLLVTQLKAGMAKPLAFANFRRLHARSPVTTPAFIPGMSQKLAMALNSAQGSAMLAANGRGARSLGGGG